VRAALARLILSEKPSLPRSVLFMCRMNAVRSPMAEAIAAAMLPAGTFVASAGILRHGARDPFVDAALAEEGLALPNHEPRTIDDIEDAYFDLVVTLAPEAHHAALQWTRAMAVDVEYWPMPDPTTAVGTREQIMAAYRDLRARLAARIARRFRLAAPGGPAD
jgi:protein-tyrosine-phosphatase